MKITLKGCNGKKREIPLEELIEKFWDEQHNPISVEMSTSTCDEEIYAEMNIMPEEKGYFPCISLESRNEKFGKHAHWFELETPNLDSPFVVGKMYAGNTKTETEEWLVRIVDGFRGSDDIFPRTIYANHPKVNIQDADGNYNLQRKPQPQHRTETPKDGSFWIISMTCLKSLRRCLPGIQNSRILFFTMEIKHLHLRAS